VQDGYFGLLATAQAAISVAELATTAIAVGSAKARVVRVSSNFGFDLDRFGLFIILRKLTSLSPVAARATKVGAKDLPGA
jgi:hypothetical protein